MSGTSNEDRTLEATPRRLEQAREKGDVPTSREGSAAGILVAALLGVVLAGPLMARQVGSVLLPMLDQPDGFLDMTEQGWREAGSAAVWALALGIAPFLLLAMMGALIPHFLQNSVVISLTRIAPKLGNLSPGRGLKRIFGPRQLMEIAKSLVKMLATAAACWGVARSLFNDHVGLVAVDVAAAPGLIRDSLTEVLLTATLIGVLIAGIDVPWQHWMWHRRQRMTLQEMRDEMRSTYGDPQVKGRQRRLRRQHSQRRMMHEVPKASVVVTNPTHYAVALRYRRGQDAAPVVVAKGSDLVALRIREVALESGVAVVEDKPLARALHAGVEIGDVIPQVHFEAVAKVIGLVMARSQGRPDGRARAEPNIS